MDVTKKIIELNKKYAEAKNKLGKKYKEQLEKLQENCEHDFWDWEFKTTKLASIVVDEDGVPIQYRNCKYCNKEELRLFTVIEEIKF